MKNTDYLIIGQGLAGSLLGLELLGRGKTVTIIDNAHRDSASVVAAGLINPVIGKRFTITENHELFFECAIQTYAELEKKFNLAIFHPKPIVRFFKNNEEREFFNVAKNDPKRAAYFSNETESSVVINGGGYCDVALLLNTLTQFFTDQGVLIQKKFDYAAIDPLRPSVEYENRPFKKIIFCEGYRVKDNPFFSYLRTAPAKGEILTLRAKDDFSSDKILNAGQWLIPLGNNLYRAGSNYNWDDLDNIPSETGKKEILDGLKFLEANFEIVDHKAGVRPASTDRKPIVGLHREYPSMAIFNGFGSRGSLLIPLYAKQISDKIEEN